VTTWAVPMDGVFMKDGVTGETVRIGRFDPDRPGRENRMVPCLEGFETVGLRALERERGGEWLRIDEIGYLEAGCEAYQRGILRAMESRRLIAVVRKQELPFLKSICAREDVFCVDLDDPFGNIGCIIMASGLGKRFGGNKLMADFCGEPMIMRAVRATEGLFARRVVVTRHEDVAQVCREAGVEVILHDKPHRSDTVRIGIEALEGVERCLFCPGDQPLLKKETVASMALSANGNENILRASHGDAPGMPAVFPEWTFDELRTLPEGKGGGYVIARHPRNVRMFAVSDPMELADADDRQAFERLLEAART